MVHCAHNPHGHVFLAVQSTVFESSTQLGRLCRDWSAALCGSSSRDDLEGVLPPLMSYSAFSSRQRYGPDSPGHEAAFNRLDFENPGSDMKRWLVRIGSVEVPPFGAGWLGAFGFETCLRRGPQRPCPDSLVPPSPLPLPSSLPLLQLSSTCSSRPPSLLWVLLGALANSGI